jgi:hypothetical protein
MNALVAAVNPIGTDVVASKVTDDSDTGNREIIPSIKKPALV